MPQTPADPVADLLRQAQTTDAVRASAWDAFHGSKDADDLASKLKVMPLPDSVKADLWDLKAGAAPAAIAPASAPKPAAAAGAPGGAGDGFSLMDAMRSGVSAVQAVPKADTNVAAGIAQAVLPSTTLSDYVQGPLYAIQHPIESAKLVLGSILDAHKQQAQQAIEAGKRVLSEPTMQGKAVAADEAAGHAAATIIPVLGPAAAAAGEQLGSGDAASKQEAIGKAIGLVGSVLLGGKAGQKPTVKVGIPPVAENLNPVAAAAVKFGEDAGIPIDAATATGRQSIKNIQKKASESFGGAGVAERFKALQEQKLAEVGNRLASQANDAGAAVSPEQAGTAIQEGVRSTIANLNDEATKAYDQLRAIEAKPENLKTVEISSTPPERFAAAGAPVDALFNGVWRDALKQGYTGTKTDLRAMFQDRVNSARSLQQEMQGTQADYGPQALLASIREYGGLKPFTEDAAGRMRGDFAQLVDTFSNDSNGGWGHRGGASIFRTNGKGLDDMVDQLRQEPRWRGIIGDESDLLDALHEIAQEGRPTDATVDLEHYLHPTGVVPGTRWWLNEEPAIGASRTEQIALPVDFRPVRAAIQPIYAKLMREKELGIPMMGDKGRALVALDGIMNGPDHVPLSVADSALSDLKSLARTDEPLLKSVGQGLAGQAVKAVDAQVRAVAASAGPEALQALQSGRAATVSKYYAAKVLKKLGDEPVQTFNKATFRDDAGIAQLRRVAQIAPDALPQVGRAYLDDLMQTATADGGFTKAKTVASAWERLGPETKALLFRDPKYIESLDNFFQLAKRIADNPNPSGTAGVLRAGKLRTAIAGYPIAKLLYSRAGVKVLTEGLQKEIGLQKVRFALGQAGKRGALKPPAPSSLSPGVLLPMQGGNTQPSDQMSERR